MAFVGNKITCSSLAPDLLACCRKSSWSSLFRFFLGTMLLLTGGCASLPESRQPVATSSPQPPAKALPASPVEKPPPAPLSPSYGDLVKQLETSLAGKGVSFYASPEGNLVPYALHSPDSFFVADKTGTCLFKILVGIEKAPGPRQTISDILFQSGPCGIKAPDLAEEATKIVAAMAENLVIPGLQDRLAGKPWIDECSEKNFLKQTVLRQLPFEIDTDGADLEKAMARTAMQIKDPLEIAFGDVVFFALPKKTSIVGVYAGYGLIVYHKDCSSAAIHRLSGATQYRIYRPVTGFAWTNYQIGNPDFLFNQIDSAR